MRQLHLCRRLCPHLQLREAPFNKSPPLFGHCPNSIYTPPPHSNGHSGALFFRRDFTILPFLPFCLPFSLNKCLKPSGQGFRPPQNQANARLNLENSSLKKCPKPSGQGFRPPPPNGQCPHRGGDKLKGDSLKTKSIIFKPCSDVIFKID